MEITQECNVDCAPQRVVIVKGEIGICLKEEVGQFSSLLPGTVLQHILMTMASFIKLKAGPHLEVEHPGGLFSCSFEALEL
jgi:hypothetical protein